MAGKSIKPFQTTSQDAANPNSDQNPGDSLSENPNDMARSEKGFFYIMTNPAQSGLVLVGTSAKHPEERLLDDDLNGPGVPLPYDIRYYALVDDMGIAMGHVHERLAHRHVDKHFYETTPGIAIEAIENAPVEILYRESDASVHEISHAGRRPRPARLSTSRGRSDRQALPPATTLRERQLRKQQVLNRMAGEDSDIDDGAPVTPRPTSSRPRATIGAREQAGNDDHVVPIAPLPEAAESVVRAVVDNTAEAFDQNAVRDLEVQSDLQIGDAQETDQSRFFEPEPVRDEVEPNVHVETDPSGRVQTIRPVLDDNDDVRVATDVDDAASPEQDDVEVAKTAKSPKAKGKKARQQAKQKARADARRKAREASEAQAQAQADADAAREARQRVAVSAQESAEMAADAAVNGDDGALPIPSLSQSSKKKDQSVEDTQVPAGNQPTPQTVAPAGIVYGPQGPVALHPIPGTPYMAVTPVQMLPGTEGKPPQPVVQTVENANGIVSSAPTSITTMRGPDGQPAMAPPAPGHALPSPAMAGGAPGMGAPAGAPGASNPAALEAWLSDQDSAQESRTRTRRAIMFSLIGIPVGALIGGAYIVLNEGLNTNQMGIAMGASIVGAMALFFVIGRIMKPGKSRDAGFDDDDDYTPQDRVPPSLS